MRQTLYHTSLQDLSDAAVGDIELSVIMPCLNEARTVGRCIDKALNAFRRLNVRGEVVVADNGSTDGSPEIARDHGARVVHVSRKGYGSALQGGIEAARGRYILMGDADDSYDFSQPDAFLDRLRAGDDLVMGNRFKGGIQPGAMSALHRYIGNPVLTGILNFFFRTPVRDAHCGLRAFSKDSYQQLRLVTPGMEFASEMVVKASLFDQKISEVPIVLYPDGRDRPPHLRSFQDGWRHLRFLLLMSPFWLFLVPAGLLLFASLTILFWRSSEAFSWQGAESIILIGSGGLLLGYQLVWLWAYATVYAEIRSFFPSHLWSVRLLRGLNIERVTVTGVLLSLVGIYLLLQSDLVGTKSFTSTPPCLYGGCVLVAFGIQTMYSGMFIGLLKSF